jgi:hypothetical protein
LPRVRRRPAELRHRLWVRSARAAAQPRRSRLRGALASDGPTRHTYEAVMALLHRTLV